MGNDVSMKKGPGGSDMPRQPLAAPRRRPKKKVVDATGQTIEISTMRGESSYVGRTSTNGNSRIGAPGNSSGASGDEKRDDDDLDEVERRRRKKEAKKAKKAEKKAKKESKRRLSEQVDPAEDDRSRSHNSNTLPEPSIQLVSINGSQSGDQPLASPTLKDSNREDSQSVQRGQHSRPASVRASPQSRPIGASAADVVLPPLSRRGSAASKSRRDSTFDRDPLGHLGVNGTVASDGDRPSELQVAELPLDELDGSIQTRARKKTSIQPTASGLSLLSTSLSAVGATSPKLDAAAAAVAVDRDADDADAEAGEGEAMSADQLRELYAYKPPEEEEAEAQAPDYEGEYQIPELAARLGPELKMLTAGFDEAVMYVPHTKPYPVSYKAYRLADGTYQADDYVYNPMTNQVEPRVEEYLDNGEPLRNYLYSDDLSNFGAEYPPFPPTITEHEEKLQAAADQLRKRAMTMQLRMDDIAKQRRQQQKAAVRARLEDEDIEQSILARRSESRSRQSASAVNSAVRRKSAATPRRLNAAVQGLNRPPPLLT